MKKLTNSQWGLIVRILVIVTLVLILFFASSCKRAANHPIKEDITTKIRPFEASNGQIIMLNDSLDLYKAGILIVEAITFNDDKTKYKIWGVYRDSMPENYYNSHTFMPLDGKSPQDSITSTIMIEYIIVKKLIL